jgi:branched-chain amino acid transport system permease protein
MEIIAVIALWFGLYAIVSLSLNLEYGYAGIPNFGRALAVLIGAISVGGILNRILIFYFGVKGVNIIDASGKVKTLVNGIIANDPLFGLFLLVTSLIIAGVVGALTGALFILPSAKLREDYLAITLLAISEVVFMISNYDVDIIGGYYGVSIPDVLAFYAGEERIYLFSLIVLFILALVYIFLEKITNSPFGRILRAMRENEDVVKAFGKDVMILRIKAAAIGSAIASIAGALYSLYSVNVIASSFARVEWTFYPFLMVLLGGAGNNKGVLAGTLTFVVVKIFLTMYKHELRELLHLPFEAVWLEYMMFGILMYLVLLYKPEGIFKEKPIFTKPLRYVVAKFRSSSESEEI